MLPYKLTFFVLSFLVYSYVNVLFICTHVKITQVEYSRLLKATDCTEFHLCVSGDKEESKWKQNFFICKVEN